MAIRTSETTVTFSHPFRFGDMDEQQPAGTYRVVSDDVEIGDLSMAGWHRIASFIRTPAIGELGRTEVYAVSPSDLTDAQAEDVRHEQADLAESRRTNGRMAPGGMV